MHRSESEQMTACVACGREFDAGSGRGFGIGGERALCFECAVGRGGTYDAAQDRWSREPAVADLEEEPR